MALDRDLIVRIALAQLDEVGLEALSLRRLATELEVHPSALYYHFKNKQDLLDEMALALVLTTARTQGPPKPDTWDGWLTHLARTQRGAARSCRDGALLIIKARHLADDQLDYLDDLIKLLVASGFSTKQAGAAFVAVSNYAIGVAVSEQQSNRTAEPPQHTESHKGIQAIAAVHGDADATFERGLRWLLDGMRPKQLRRK